MKTSSLLKSIRRVAAKELHNTRGIPENLRRSDKFELLNIAYGEANIVDDFEKWCREVKSQQPRYPITAYLQVVDSRLGDVPESTDPVLNLTDPRIKTVSAAIYDLAAFTPARKAVATLLLDSTEEEILAATKEYVDSLDDKDFKKNMTHFFADGGCAIVIYARRNRK